jgi:hypothetical protein
MASNRPAIKLLKRFLLIVSLPALFGVFFCIKYIGVDTLLIIPLLSAMLPGFFWALLTKEPDPTGIRYTYIKDKSKIFGLGECIRSEDMHFDKTLDDAKKETKDFVNKTLGGEGRAFVNLFLIPFLFIMLIAFTLVGWTEFFSVREAALNKLTDQALLARTAVEGKDSDVREAALDKLTDQALLARTAVEHKDYSVRQTAVAKLTDQALLAKIAIKDKDRYVRDDAVAKLTDQALLAKIAVEDENGDVREAAVDKLTDRLEN